MERSGVGDESPFLEWDWLASLEKAGAVGGKTGWGSRPLVARENGRLVAACPVYLKLHSEGEFVFDWGWADASQRAGIPYYPKILVGVPFTPVTGARFLAAPGEDRGRWIALLGEALRDTCIANEISGVHVNFCQDEELDALEKLDFQVRFGLQYHWLNDGYASFEDYLARFRSKRRNQIRRERRELERQDVVIETYAGSEIPGRTLFPPMYEFYKTTVQEHFYGRQYLNFPRLRTLTRPLPGTARLSSSRARANNSLAEPSTSPRPAFCTVDTGVPHDPCGTSTSTSATTRPSSIASTQALNASNRVQGGNYKQLRGFDPQPTRGAPTSCENRAWRKPLDSF